MKKIFLLCLIGIFMNLFCACETKYDQNGDLDGMWQMLRWEDVSNQTLHADKNDGIYYCFQLNLMKIWKAGRPQFYYLSYFTHKGDSIVIGNVFSYPGDSIRNVEDMIPYGVPANGRFHVDALSASKMVLSHGEQTLTFRKY